MTMRTYWCVVQRAERRRNGNIRWEDTDGFNCDLDLDLPGGVLSGLRAALLTGIHRAGGDEAAAAWYRLNAFDGNGDVAAADYVAPPDFPVPESLDGYTDGQLIAELARRLSGR
jgi:hypothetical protein